MNPVSRDWATPLTIGAFALMAVTGLLMFFHLDSGVQKAAHEWLGWGLVAAVGLHATANVGAFKRHLESAGRGRVILVACGVLLAASFFVAPPGAGGASPPVLAMRAVARAPLGAVAPLAGKSVEQARGDLAMAGIVVASENQSIDSVVAGDREKLGRAMQALFRTNDAAR